ncbi:D-2-hydroxyacid dehydrogenase [Cohnella cellulosilytica]|uniref:D-2-hydroxyacid dehydrogenase n=1 Tax=Cohnella cellulosilytica TaxID=986710 RepID=A0ABW2FCT7_9BACL
MKIVVLDGHALNPGDLSWSGLERLGEVTVYDRTPPERVAERAADADAVLTNKTRLPADALRQLPKLKYIGVLATGYDVIDIAAARERGIVVANVPGYGTQSVAQLVFALLLELCQHAGLHDRSVKDGDWSRSADWCYWNKPLVELHGKTIGIVGYGSIGEQVGRIAHAFGLKVAAYRRSPGGEPPFDRFSWVGLDELWETSDVVSLHCPLTSETAGLVNRSSLARMKKSAFLINTARGGLVDERALADCLNAGGIAGAAVDVLSSEPPASDNPLLTAANCIVTPHLAWATHEARTRLLQTVTDNLAAFLDGKPANVVS